jgi:hypothetical protein
VKHLADNGVTPEEAEQVLAEPVEHGRSRSSGRPIVFGYTAAGRRLAVVYEQVDAITVYPITVYEPEEEL